MTEQENKKQEAVDLAVHWARTGLMPYSMQRAVNDYMDACGANNADSEENVVGRRRICAQSLTIACITPLTKDELHRVEQQLDRIAVDDAPGIRRGMRR